MASTKRDGIPAVTAPSPYKSLGYIFLGKHFIGWVTLWGWQGRYLFADDWLLAPVAGEWVTEKEFGEKLGLRRLNDYRVEWIA